MASIQWEAQGRLLPESPPGTGSPRSKSGPVRDAKLAVRFAQVKLTRPKNSKLAPALLWAIHACEIEYGTDVKSPLEWMFLTTVEVSTFEDAATCLGWYTQRWNIEIYHRTLKSGCRIEDRWLDSSDDLKACLAVGMVVGWRVLWATKAARETPELPCDVFFSRDERRVLEAWSTNEVPDKPPSLRSAVRKVAQLGGFLGRKGDGEPGVTTTWRGLVKLEAMAIGWAMAEARPKQRDGP
ncbi:MAG: IS4 family transposase [Thermodesulfobacteriota bacterium]